MPKTKPAAKPRPEAVAIAPVTETLKWVRVDQRVSDPEVTVLLYVPAADEPVWPGYRDEDDSGTRWFWADGSEITDQVAHWADIPAGPDGG